MRLPILAALLVLASPLLATPTFAKDAGREKPAKAAALSPAAQAVNAFRRENGLGPVSDDAALLRAAQKQADAMAAAGVMSHDVAGGFSSRVNAAGIKAGEAAENVAMGQRSLAEVMQDWKNSSGHRKNMLMASATRVAVAQRKGADGKLYWAMVLATPEPAPRTAGAQGGFTWGGPFLFFP